METRPIQLAFDTASRWSSFNRILREGEIGIEVGTGKAKVGNGSRWNDLPYGPDFTGIYEPVFSKNTAFNKDFGTAAGTVAEGDHIHDDRYYTETELQSSGSSNVHWDNITNAPSFGDVQWQDPVPDVASLPSSGNTVNDVRLVQDDGDGKPAQYTWDGTQWIKIADVDWNTAQYIDFTANLTSISSGNVRDAVEEVQGNVSVVSADLSDHELLSNPHGTTASDVGAAEEVHTHVKTDITDFDHTHVKSDITDFDHTHVKADITDFDHTHIKADITDFSDSDYEIPIQTTATVYLDENRTDSYTPNGSQARPYTTIDDAIAAASTIVGDPSLGSCTIVALKGAYSSSANIVLPDNTNLIGDGQGKTNFYNKVVTGSSGKSRLENISFRAGLEINNDVVAYYCYSPELVTVNGTVQGEGFTSQVSSGSALVMNSGASVTINLNSFTTADDASAITMASGAGQLILIGASVQNTSASSPSILSNGGTFQLISTNVVNTGGGPSLQASNDATAQSPNMISAVYQVGDMSFGSSPTIVQTLLGSGAHTGTAVTYPPSSQLSYDNTSSGMTAMHVQSAIDELDSRVDDPVMPTTSGAPSDSPDIATYRFDSSTNILYIYNGTSWVSTTLS